MEGQPFTFRRILTSFLTTRYSACAWKGYVYNEIWVDIESHVHSREVIHRSHKKIGELISLELNSKSHMILYV